MTLWKKKMTLSRSQRSVSHYQIGLELGEERHYLLNYSLLGPPDYHDKRGAEEHTKRTNTATLTAPRAFLGLDLYANPFYSPQAKDDPFPALGHAASSRFPWLGME